MVELKDFKIRKMVFNENSKYLSGKEAVVEYIRQRLLIIRNELWWDYNYGLDLQNINEENILYRIRDCIRDIPYIQNLTDIKIIKDDNTYKIFLNIEFNDNSVYEEWLNVNYN